MERIYLNKLDRNYFEKCISDIIEESREYQSEFALEMLEDLVIQVVSLRDIFYLYSIDILEELLNPVYKEIKTIKNNRRIDHTIMEKDEIIQSLERGIAKWKNANEQSLKVNHYEDENMEFGMRQGREECIDDMEDILKSMKYK